MKRLMQNEKGLTLVEILAALVILGIVLVSVMSFFTQSAKFTAHNNEKLTNIQVAEEVIAEIRPLNFTLNNNNMPARDKVLEQLVEYESLNDNTYQTEKYNPYKVVVELREGPSGLEKQLKKALVIVESPADTGISTPTFSTEMYFEVQP
ncbi:prepilin-type N-terminal cleavage/methylation domain-containing protein [Planococcus donghaensis]|uniref:type IV pilus modification PilV family protein n=1 Tax=Planococcus donghaensis TaxID=414778 RepID=UPI003734DF7D